MTEISNNGMDSWYPESRTFLSPLPEDVVDSDNKTPIRSSSLSLPRSLSLIENVETQAFNQKNSRDSSLLHVTRNDPSSNLRERRKGELAPPEISLVPPTPTAEVQSNKGSQDQEGVRPFWEMQWEVTPPQLLTFSRSKSENTVGRLQKRVSGSSYMYKRQRSSSKQEQQRSSTGSRPGRFSLDHRVRKRSSDNLEVGGKSLSFARSPALLKNLKIKHGITMEMRSPSLWKQLRKTSADARYIIEIVDIKDRFGDFVKNRRCSRDALQDMYLSGKLNFLS